MYRLNIIEEGLQSLPIDTFHYYEQIDSTNTRGLALLQHNLVQGNWLLLAQEQSAGRGRFKRQWISDPDDSLTFSLVMTAVPDLPHEKLSLIALAGALSVTEALGRWLPACPARIKWPNDILLNGRKAAGMLSEALWQGEQLQGVVLGIGINVGAAATPPDDQLLYPATSIEQACGKKPDREALLLEILRRFFRWFPQLQSSLFLSRYQNDLAFLGESVNIFNEMGQQAASGIFRGVDQQGNLVLQQEDGNILCCSAGEITVRPA